MILKKDQGIQGDERDLKPGIGLLLISCLLELDWLIQLVDNTSFFLSFYIRLLLRYTVGS